MSRAWPIGCFWDLASQIWNLGCMTVASEILRLNGHLEINMTRSTLMVVFSCILPFSSKVTVELPPL